MMFEIVAVGAIATQFELRIPWLAMRARSASQVHRARRVNLDVAAARLGEQLHGVCGRMPRSQSEPR